MFGLTVQRRVDFTRQETLYRLAVAGNNEGIRMMLGKREAYPDDVEVFTGQSALYVCDPSNSLKRHFNKEAN